MYSSTLSNVYFCFFFFVCVCVFIGVRLLLFLGFWQRQDIAQQQLEPLRQVYPSQLSREWTSSRVINQNVMTEISFLLVHCVFFFFFFDRALVQKYLLEKTRICFQAKNERNYHVFYHLLVGSSAQEKQALHLLPPETYRYLNQVWPVDICPF